MKTWILSLVLSICMGTTQAQQLRYFEFTPECGHGNWQDTSFIAATSDLALIDSIYTELAKPKDQRTLFIAGEIDYGHGGYNHNANHWFRWHYKEDKWRLAEVAMEVCDGCPYSDVDADTAYWVRNIGAYCSWGAIVSREVMKPTTIETPHNSLDLHIFPNPATDIVTITGDALKGTTAELYTTTGQLLKSSPLDKTATIDISNLPAGLYLVRLTRGTETVTQKLLVQR
jgi:hypothetical protein